MTTTLPVGNAPARAITFERRRMLPPSWAFVGIFTLYPLWWVLGVAEFVWAGAVIPLGLALLYRRRLVVPRGFPLFAAFLVWAIASGTMLDSGGRAIGFAMRLGWYAGAVALLLFVLNPPADLGTERVVRIMTRFWMVVVAGGYVGLLVPNLRIVTPMARILPGSLRANEFIEAMVVAGTADVQDFLGYPIPRPRAPFTFTNGWGAAFALLAPFVIASLSTPSVGVSRRLLRLTVVASVVPVVISLNRGLWLSLGLGVLYGAMRFAVSGQVRALLAVVAVAVVTVCMLLFTPLGSIAESRIETPHSDEGRRDLYLETIDRTLESPLLGYGAPRPQADGRGPSVGTHGQLWLTMFSHGFPGAILYVGFFLSVLWHTRRPVSLMGFWAHVTVFIGCIQMLYYGQLPQQLAIMMVATGVAYRESRHGVRRVDAPIGPHRESAGPGPADDEIVRELGALPPVPADLASDVRRAAAAQPAPGAGPDDVRELAWLSSLLWSPASGVRLVEPASVGSGDTIVGSFLVAPSSAQPRLLVDPGRRVAPAAIRKHSDGSTVVGRARVELVAAAARAGVVQALRRDRVHLVSSAGAAGIGATGPLASRSSPLGPGDALTAHLAGLLGERHLSCSLTVGPRRANRKPVLQLVRDTGETVAYAKVGWDPLTKALVANEARWLRYLETIPLRHFTAPRVVATSRWRELDVVLVTPARMHVLPRRRGHRLPSVGLLREIAELGGIDVASVAESRFADDQLLGAGADSSLVARVLERIGDVELPFGTWHGDLSPWNLSTGTRAVSVIDWEFASMAVPVGFDALHHEVQVAQILEGREPSAALDRGRASSTAALLAMGVPESARDTLFACYLLALRERALRMTAPGDGSKLGELAVEVCRRLETIAAPAR